MAQVPVRLVELLVPPDREERIVDYLEEEDIDYVVTEEGSDREYESVIRFALPTGAVESVLDSLEDLDIERDAHVFVVEAEAVISDRFEGMRDRYEDGEVEEDRISRQELQAHADELTPTMGVYITLTVVSALVATAGLLLDSPAVVVGSMVIAPLIGPALGASIGSVLGEDDLVAEGVKFQLLGVIVAIAAAAAFAAVVRYANVVPPGFDIVAVDEIRERLAPNVLALVIALGAGVAGILSIAAGVSVALVGVMIAAALIPPAAVAGLALAFGEPMAALGAGVLVFVNLLSINLAGLSTLWFVGYRPSSYFAIEPAKERVTRQIVGLSALTLVFAAVLLWITYTSFLVGTFEERAEDEAAAVLDQEEYAEYRLVSLTAEPTEDSPVPAVDRVTVTVAGPAGGPPPDLVAALDEAVNRHSEERVTVEVTYRSVAANEPAEPTPSLLEGQRGLVVDGLDRGLQ